MATQTPGKPRAVISHDGIDYKITIPSKKNYLLIIFFPLSFIVGIPIFIQSGAYKQISATAKSTGSEVFIIIWFTGMLLSYLFTLIITLWSAIGKEYVKVNRSTLTVKKSIFGFGLNKEYDLTQAKDFYVDPSYVKKSGAFGSSNNKLKELGFIGGIIAFSYGMKTVRFAGSIEVPEAQKILNDLSGQGYIKLKEATSA